MQWTEDRLKWARAILANHDSIGDAAREMGVSKNALQQAFGRANETPGQWLTNALDGAEVPPVPDPVARVATARAESRLKAEHGALATEVGALREQIAAMSAIASAPLPPIPRYELGSGLREATAVALLSDIHVEELVRPGDTPTGNAYNLAIADLRLGRFFEGAKWLVEAQRERFKIRSFCLWLGGDLGSGHIHPENVETSALSPIETMLWLYPRLRAGCLGLANDLGLERLDVVCSYGNHGRDTIKPRFATGAAHSYEWGLYQTLANDLKTDPRIRFLADTAGHQYHRIYDYDVGFHHGDAIKYAGGVGGISIPLNKAVDAWNSVRRCDFWNFGHWHSYLDYGSVTVNGSGIGYNAYAMRIKARPEPPQQAFYLLDSKRGKTAKSPIWVGDPSAEVELWRAA